MKKIWTLILLVSFLSCAQNSKKHNEDYIAAVNWFQKAAETKALFYQAFNLAEMKIDEDIKKGQQSRKRAVILDIDETVLDNSPYQAEVVLSDISYPDKWNEWVEMRKATVVPGAKEFLESMVKKNIEIFYVSNRKLNELDATFDNLKAAGLPVKKENLYLRDKTSSKTERRNEIRKNFRIVLLMGDNLNDFDDIFDANSLIEREKNVDALSSTFGTKYIVFPNPMYGTWEDLLFKQFYDFDMAAILGVLEG